MRVFLGIVVGYWVVVGITSKTRAAKFKELSDAFHNKQEGK